MSQIQSRGIKKKSYRFCLRACLHQMQLHCGGEQMLKVSKPQLLYPYGILAFSSHHSVQLKTLQQALFFLLCMLQNALKCTGAQKNKKKKKTLKDSSHVWSNHPWTRPFCIPTISTLILTCGGRMKKIVGVCAKIYRVSWKHVDITE